MPDDTRALTDDEREVMERAWTDSHPEHQHNAKANFEAGFTAGLRYRDGAEPSEAEVEAAALGIHRAIYGHRAAPTDNENYESNVIRARAALEAARKASP